MQCAIGVDLPAAAPDDNLPANNLRRANAPEGCDAMMNKAHNNAVLNHL
jgi:hypothetical protein